MEELFVGIAGDWASGFFWGLVIGVGGLLKLQKWLDRRETPYRYVCKQPGCCFEVKSTEMSTVDLWATTHERNAHGGS